MLKKIKQKCLLPEQIADTIIELIIADKYEPGDKIPTELQLSEQLQVGRSSIREAIKVLISRNILYVKRGIGTFVSENKGVSDDPLGFAFVANKSKLANDLFELRAMIEPSIARKCAQFASKEEVEKIEFLCNEIEYMIEHNISHLEKDIEFHALIAKSSQNTVVYKLLPIISGSIESVYDVAHGVLAKETILTHRKIVEAIKSGNGEDAYNAMKAHMDYNIRHIT
ncbi:MAG: FadR/GntR family transcriptional regulator [Longicatena sp.]